MDSVTEREVWRQSELSAIGLALDPLVAELIGPPLTTRRQLALAVALTELRCRLEALR